MPEAERKRLNIVWGAKAIGKAIGRNERQVFHLLENRLLRGAYKIGKTHVLDVDVYRAAARDSLPDPDHKPQPAESMTADVRSPPRRACGVSEGGPLEEVLLVP